MVLGASLLQAGFCALGAERRRSPRTGYRRARFAHVDHPGLRRNPTLGGGAALLPNRDGRAMTRAKVNQRLDIAVARATKGHSSLVKRSISPHTIRHTIAMHLLQSGVAFSVIALWLGHESTTTTHRYVEADLAMKDKALARLQQPDTKMRRYRLRDALMQFLQALQLYINRTRPHCPLAQGPRSTRCRPGYIVRVYT